MKKRSLLPVLLVLFLSLPTVALGGSSFDTLVVFGDSLSDNGNLYALTANTSPDPDYYYQGRFSNGPVWVEYLADASALDCTLVDYAYGGATTDGASPPGLIAQVSAYTGSATLGDKTLFAIWIGANDFLNGSTDYATSAGNIGAALDDLASFGAEHILIVNLPDLGSTPRLLGTPGEAGARALSQAFNAALAAVVDVFQAANPDITVYEFDVYAFLQATAADPADYGFTNATEVCPAYYTADDFDNSAGYVFWDEIHPTTEAHEVIADQVLAILPEESSDGSSSPCFINSLLTFGDFDAFTSVFRN